MSYYQRNRELVIERAKQYYLNHKEERKEYVRNYQKIHKDKKRIWAMNDKRRVRQKLLIFLGNVCVVCGTTERIEIDHKQAGGCADRISKGNNWEMYRYYLKHPEEAKEKLQLLCKTHNLHKEHKNGERWPHK